LDPLRCELPGHLVVAVWSPERLVLHVTPIDGVFLGTRSDLVHPAPRPEKVAEPSLRNAERPSCHPKTHKAVRVKELLRNLDLGLPSRVTFPPLGDKACASTAHTSKFSPEMTNDPRAYGGFRLSLGDLVGS